MTHPVSLWYSPRPVYVGTFSHLNERQYLGDVHMTKPLAVRSPDENDISDEGSWRATCRLPAGLTKRQRKLWARTIAAKFSSTGCHHEWDCCGCRVASARVHVVGRRVTVTVSEGRNY